MAWSLTYLKIAHASGEAGVLVVISMMIAEDDPVLLGGEMTTTPVVRGGTVRG